ncbi:MAG: hypothetical protein KGJ35_02930, partial [Patescibacteria group bacterium]|nr:hypothetical protein [Patescibacteria group bacterium]
MLHSGDNNGNEDQPDSVDESKDKIDSWDSYDDACASKAVRNEWYDKYSKDPNYFFSPQNLDLIKGETVGKRVLWFSLSAGNIQISPDDTDLYFDMFPEDLDLIRSMVSHNGSPNNSREFNLWSMSAHRLFQDEVKDGRSMRFSKNKQWIDINDRRREAPKHLLSNGVGTNVHTEIESFGAAASNFTKSFDKANGSPFGLDDFIKTDEIFSSAEYEVLTPEKKSELLGLCLAEIQRALVFGEANNSAFTKERVEEANARGRQGAAQGRIYHNVAHSMLYKTFQPSAIYNEAQSRFEYEMRSTAAVGGSVEEYPFHRILLEILKEYKKIGDKCSEKDADILVEFWDKNRNPIFANSVTDALGAINPEYASIKLLEAARKEPIDKNALIAILYRIEFRRLGISSEGVKYLDHIYDLAEFNNPGNFVERLTPNGDMGIFNSNEELLRYFNLGDPTQSVNKIKSAVFDFAYEAFFSAKENETDEEKKKRQSYIEEFKRNYSGFASQEVFSDEVQARNFSFKEQGAALVLLHELDSESKERLIDLVKTEGESGLHVFLRFYDLDHEIAVKALGALSATSNLIDKHKILELLASISSYIPRLDDEFDRIKHESDIFDDADVGESDRSVIQKEIVSLAKMALV